MFHMTRVEHLDAIVSSGLLCDLLAPTQIGIGHQHIKDRRRQRTVNVGRGGTVADYAPFYFNPLSPMQSEAMAHEVRAVLAVRQTDGPQVFVRPG